MHSKVIIASLVCMLAASFGTNKMLNAPNDFSKRAFESASLAPNDMLSNVEFDSACGDSGSSITVTFEYEKELPELVILDKSETFCVEHFCGGDFIYVEMIAPSVAGDYYVKFGYEDETNQYLISSIYVYTDGNHYYASSLSANDARSKFFIEYIATQKEITKLFGWDEYNGGFEHGPIDFDPPIIEFPGPGPKQPTIGKNMIKGVSGDATRTKGNRISPVFEQPGMQTYIHFGPEEHFANYVYKGTNDIETAVYYTNYSENSGWSFFNETIIQTNINWVDENNNTHPLRGIKTELMTDTEAYGFTSETFVCSLNSNNQGVGYATIPFSTANKYKMTDLRVKLTAENKAVKMFTDSSIKYSYYYRFTSNSLFAVPYLSDYAQVTLNITIYPGRSDRADAFEIAEAENLPHNFSQAAGNIVGKANVYFPTSQSEYTSSITNSPIIKIQKENAHNWDVLNHEYGHYICDNLNLDEGLNGRMPHNVDADLIRQYGEYRGKKLAYSEGLATFIGIASQYFDVTVDSNIPGIADMIYQDPFRHVEIDYTEYAIGKINDYEFVPQAYETSITGTLLKVLQVAIDRCVIYSEAFAEMIRVLKASEKNIDSVLEKFIQRNPILASEINEIMSSECFFGDQEYLSKAEWTIMIYMCGTTLERDFARASLDIHEILSVPNQPEDVNIIIETGGSTHWHDNDELYRIPNVDIPDDRIARYHVANNKLVLDCELDAYEDTEDVGMGDEATFKSFLDWGLQNYPARKTGVILWNHGGGLLGCCFDEYDYDDGLDATEVANALDSALAENNISKLEFIGYNACIMQLQDIAEINSHYFKYMVASEEVLFNCGWAYDEWIDDVYAGDKDTKDILKELVYKTVYTNDSDCLETVEYMDTNPNQPPHPEPHPETLSTYNPQTNMSLLDLSNMSAYHAAFENFASAIAETVQNNFDRFVTLINQSKKFAGDSFDIYGTIDAVDFLSRLSRDSVFQQFSGQIHDLIQKYYDVVVYNVIGTEALDSTGLAIQVVINESQQYPVSQTHFYNWRSLFVAD